MSTTSTFPASIGRQSSVRANRGAASPRFESEEDTRLVRVDDATAGGGAGVAAESLSPETALAVLANSTVAELRFLRVDETAEAIHLSGNVGSFYHKQLAQEAMRPIADGRLVVNQVEVKSR
jgi:hypothetical protein